MRWKSTVALATIFAALAAFYYLYDVRLAPERERASQAKGRLWTVEAKDMEEVVLRRKADTVHLKREGDLWVLLAPVRAKADAVTVRDMITNLVGVRVEREVDPNPATLADFGLDSPAADLSVKVAGKSEPLTLLLGGRNPTGAWVYGKTRDKPAVFLLSDFTLRNATKPLADFRDKTVLAFDRKDVTGLEIKIDGDLLAAEPEAETKWKITKPVSLPADWDAISDFLDKLRFARVKEFVAEAPSSLGPYGLGRPTQVTIALRREKDRAFQTLLLGRQDPAKKGAYAMRPGEPSVLLVGEDLWAALPKNVAALRDKTVIDYDRDKVARVELESRKGKVILVREGEKWQITAPEPSKANDSEVGGLLWKIRQARAQGFLGDGPADTGRYIPKPEVKVSLWEQGATAPKTLLLGPSAEQRGHRPMAYAATLGQGPVMLVDAQLLGDLAKSAMDLRDRALLSYFEPKDVTRLKIRSGGQSMSLERKGEADWRLMEPKGGKANDSKVTDLLYGLRSLRWKDLVSPKGEDARRYGLDAPSVEVTLFKADGKEIGTLLVGRREADKAYVRTGSSPSIFALDPSQLGVLPKNPDDLRG